MIREGLIILIPFHRLRARTYRHMPPMALLADAWRSNLERRTAGTLLFDVLAHRFGNGLLVWLLRLKHRVPPSPADDNRITMTVQSQGTVDNYTRAVISIFSRMSQGTQASAETSTHVLREYQMRR